MEYSPFRAVLLVAQYALVSNGMAVETAARALRSSAATIAEGPLVVRRHGKEKGVYSAGKTRSVVLKPPTNPKEDIWIGFAARPEPNNPLLLYGSWKDINLDMTSGLPSLEKEPGENFAALFMANFSQAQRIVNGRAAAHKIDLT